MTAVRLARGATGRNKVVKFAGCYHGHLDALLVQAGSGVATLGLPGSAGVTPGTVADTIVVPYNDVDALDAVMATHGPDVAAILVEPIAANMGLVAPDDGFLAALRDRCTAPRRAARVRRGHHRLSRRPGGAQGRVGITPDLSIFGKVIGGGLPARRGRRPGRAHGRPRAARRGVPGGHAVGESRSRPRPASRCSSMLDAGAYDALEDIAARLERRAARRVRRSGRRRAGHARVHARRGVLHRRAGHELRRRAGRRSRRATRASSTGCSIAACSSRRAATRRCSRASRTPTPTSTPRSPPRPTPPPRGPTSVVWRRSAASVVAVLALAADLGPCRTASR